MGVIRNDVLQRPIVRNSPISRPDSTSSSTLAVSHNQRILDEFGFLEETLTPEEKQNYERYCCAITQEVMTTPVFTANAPQYVFEELSILRRLRDINEHPFTRNPLFREQLLTISDLKAEIEQFVQDRTRPTMSTQRPM